MKSSTLETFGSHLKFLCANLSFPLPLLRSTVSSNFIAHVSERDSFSLAAGIRDKQSFERTIGVEEKVVKESDIFQVLKKTAD